MRSLLLAAVFLLAAPVAAEELSAQDIVSRATDGSMSASIRETVTMTLTDARGESTKREISIARQQVPRYRVGVWNTRIEFKSPKDVAGTVLLSVATGSGNADQYLYLPGLKRVRRIAGSQKSGSFQGSDFAYEDLTVREVGTADYRKLADEKIEADDCWQVEATAKKGVDTGYGKTISDIRKSDFLTLRVRFFDPKNVELKTLTVDPAKLKEAGWSRADSGQPDGKAQIPTHLEMKTLKDGHRTLLDVSAIDLSPISQPGFFDPASLDKG